MKRRDHNIRKAFQREIDLREKQIPSKKKYSRKTKHKSKEDF